MAFSSSWAVWFIFYWMNILHPASICFRTANTEVVSYSSNPRQFNQLSRSFNSFVFFLLWTLTAVFVANFSWWQFGCFLVSFTSTNAICLHWHSLAISASFKGYSSSSIVCQPALKNFHVAHHTEPRGKRWRFRQKLTR